MRLGGLHCLPLALTFTPGGMSTKPHTQWSSGVRRGWCWGVSEGGAGVRRGVWGGVSTLSGKGGHFYFPLLLSKVVSPATIWLCLASVGETTKTTPSFLQWGARERVRKSILSRCHLKNYVSRAFFSLPRKSCLHLFLSGKMSGCELCWNCLCSCRPECFSFCFCLWLGYWL